MEQQEMTRRQFELAKTGDAEGQCTHCGSYRADGKPPVLHNEGCPERGKIPAWSLPAAGLAGRVRAALDAAHAETQAELDAAGDDWQARGGPAGRLMVIERYQSLLSEYSDVPETVKEIAVKYGVEV